MSNHIVARVPVQDTSLSDSSLQLPEDKPSDLSIKNSQPLKTPTHDREVDRILDSARDLTSSVKKQKWILSLSGSRDGQVAAERIANKSYGNHRQWISGEQLNTRLLEECSKETDLVWTDHGEPGLVEGKPASFWANYLHQLGLKRIGKISVAACDSAKPGPSGKSFVEELALALDELGIEYEAIKGRIGEVGVKLDGTKVVSEGNKTYHQSRGHTLTYSKEPETGALIAKDIYLERSSPVEPEEGTVFLPRPPTLYGREQGDHISAYALVVRATVAELSHALNSRRFTEEIEFMVATRISEVEAAMNGSMVSESQQEAIEHAVENLRAALAALTQRHTRGNFSLLRQAVVALENLHPLAVAGIGGTGGREGSALQWLDRYENLLNRGETLTPDRAARALSSILDLVDVAAASDAMELENEVSAEDQGSHLAGTRRDGNSIEETRQAIAERHANFIRLAYPNIYAQLGSEAIIDAVLERFLSGSDD